MALHTPRNHRGSGVRAAADGWNANNLLFIIFVPLQAPSAVVIVPHDGEEEGKPGFSAATRGAAPGPRCWRSGECPGAMRGTFYTPVVVGGRGLGRGFSAEKVDHINFF